MENKNITCKDCGKQFVFSVREQRFYEEKGFVAPVRCKDCRSAKKNTDIEIKKIYDKLKANTIKI